jgi:acetolactate decarboxylase
MTFPFTEGMFIVAKQRGKPMSKHIMIIFFVALLCCLVFTSCKPPVEDTLSTDTLYQYSTLGSLMAGVYDGALTFGELKSHGDFGLGTFNTLDGEMVAIDGNIYQVKSDGSVQLVSDDMKTPFSVVTFFESDDSRTVNERMDCDALKAMIDEMLPTENIPYAIKVSGDFSYIKTRSVPAQIEPYPPLLDVIADQPTFKFKNIQGDMLGFRLPDYMDIANSPGYHFHFLNSDKNAGGHVLGCQVANVTIELDYTDEWLTELPADHAFYNVDISGDEYQ